MIKINVVAEPNLPRGIVTATVVLNDGRQYKEVVEHPTGSPEHPMTDSQVEGKFRALSAAVLSEDCIERLLDASWRLEKVADLRFVTSLTTGTDAGRLTPEGFHQALTP